MNQFNMSNMEIEEFCEALVLDYIRKYNAPTDYIDIRGLITDYLGLEIEFESIVEDDETITAFIANGSRTLKIINNGKVTEVLYPRKTMVVDKCYLAPDQRERCRFNMAHEAGHYLMNKLCNTNLNGYEAMRDDTDPRVKEVRINHARWAFKKCTAMFNDKRENLRRWLDGEPCVFVSPVTGALIEIEIGEDFDAMFHFLEFCRKQNNHEPIDDDFCDYLALLITKSQRRCCEEC